MPSSAIGSSQPHQGGKLHLSSVPHSFIHKHELNSLLPSWGGTSALVAIREDFPEEAANSEPCLACHE